MGLSSETFKFHKKKLSVLSDNDWEDEIILKKNAMSLQCRYLCKFPARSILSSAVPQFSAQGGTCGTPWGPGVLSCFRWNLHPPSQAWPLFSTSNRGGIAIAKCGNLITSHCWGLDNYARVCAVCNTAFLLAYLIHKMYCGSHERGQWFPCGYIYI